MSSMFKPIGLDDGQNV